MNMFNFLVCVAVYLSLALIGWVITESLNVYTEHCNNKSYEHCYQKSIKKSEGIAIIENRNDLWSAVRK